MLLHNRPSLLTKSTFTLILLTPLVFPGFFPFDVNLVLAIGATLLFMGCLALDLKYLYIPKIFVLAIICILAIQTSLFAGESLLAPEAWRLQSFAYLASTFMLIAGVSASATSLRTWMHLYMFAAAVWSAIGLFVWLGGTSGMPLEIGQITVALAPALKIAGPFNQGNIFATVIGFALIFAHWLYIRSGKPVYALAVVIYSAMLIDSLSKGGWLAFSLAIAILVIASKPNAMASLKRLAPLWLAGLVLGLCFLEFSQPYTASGGAFLSITQADATLSFRLLIWASAIAEFLSLPWTGVGWGQFPAEFWIANPQAQAWLSAHLGLETSLYANAMSAHNMLLQVLAEAGIIAALLLIWGIWKLLKASIALIANDKSARLPFALAVCAFILQSQFNISYIQPIPLLMATFFAGITLAPWLRSASWTIRLQPALRGTVLVVASAGLIWSAQLSLQWFAAEKAIRDFDIKNENSVRNLAEIATMPRIGTIPLIWIGYNVATTHEHPGLLTWVQPYLKQSIHEIPFVDSYQVLFYAYAYTQNFKEACQLGKIISERNLPRETNRQAYEEVCQGSPVSNYRFGHL